MFDVMKRKWDTDMAIPYFQAHTNTYAPIETLRSLYYEALTFDGVVGMNIATRADCLSDDVCTLLAEIAERTVLTVELGLQSVHEETAKLINRCHTYSEFCDGYAKLRAASDKINICIHLIEGLPGEDHDMMVESARKVALLHPEQIKLHCLNVLKNTALASLYESGRYTPITRDEFISVVCDSLELFPADIVIGRLTGDADRKKLIEPIWSLRKTEVINAIDRELYERNSYQGIHSVL
jgi:radical SAM protein (TIGR01212 family)